MATIRPYTEADLRRLRSLQVNAGRSRPRVREYRRGLHMARWVARRTDSGALVVTEEYRQGRRDRKDAMVRVPTIRVPLLMGGGIGR